MLICCVKTGDKYGDEYVVKLRNGVARHCRQPFEFVVFTDRPVDGIASRPLPTDWPGWFAKIGLFQLREPCLYLDLDIVITGDMTPLLDWRGFGILADPWLPMFNSSVMRLTGNEGRVSENFKPGYIDRLRYGDQQWITEQMPDAKTFPAEWIPSFKAQRCNKVPAGAIAVNFHGRPKPDEFVSGWVKDLWV